MTVLTTAWKIVIKERSEHAEENVKKTQLDQIHVTCYAVDAVMIRTKKKSLTNVNASFNGVAKSSARLVKIPLRFTSANKSDILSAVFFDLGPFLFNANSHLGRKYKPKYHLYSFHSL